MYSTVGDACQDTLVWLTEHGLGVYNSSESFDYGSGYWEQYREWADTPMGHRLLACRLDMLRKHHPGTMEKSACVDIGIGSGAFVERVDCLGYDVMPQAKAWLAGRDASWHADDVDVMCFWDSFEHIEDPWALLACCNETVLMSMPIYETSEHCLRSKHLKPGEHLWYFTSHGLIDSMRVFGWKCVDINDGETKAGREDILSFAFKRIE